MRERENYSSVGREIDLGRGDFFDSVLSRMGAGISREMTEVLVVDELDRLISADLVGTRTGLV